MISEIGKFLPLTLLLLLFVFSGTAGCGVDDSPDPPDNGEETIVTADPAVIDISEDRQVISGFGAANIVEWRPDLTDNDIEKAFGTGLDQLGLLILHLRVPHQTSQFNLNVPTAQKAYDMGVTVIASPWTPPANLKTNSDIVGGRLRDDAYADYAAHLKSFADFMADNGVPLHAISVQNEPDIEVDYESCDWTAQEMGRFVRDYAPSIGVDIIAPESYNFNKTISDVILQDPEAADNLAIVGGHIYGGGFEPYPLAEEKGKELWMTEHLDTETTYTSILNTAKDIHDSMTYANFNAYLWWYLKRFYSFLADDEGPQSTEEGMITKRGYIMSHYSRFIRPGYVRKETDYNPGNDVYISAYEGDGRLVIVALNLGFVKTRQPFVVLNSEHSITSMDPYVTTAAVEENVSRKETVVFQGETPEFTFDIPARSIVTFVESD